MLGSKSPAGLVLFACLVFSWSAFGELNKCKLLFSGPSAYKELAMQNKPLDIQFKRAFESPEQYRDLLDTPGVMQYVADKIREEGRVSHEFFARILYYFTLRDGWKSIEKFKVLITAIEYAPKEELPEARVFLGFWLNHYRHLASPNHPSPDIMSYAKRQKEVRGISIEKSIHQVKDYLFFVEEKEQIRSVIEHYRSDIQNIIDG